MTYATSAQALEFLANDTPARYRADAAIELIGAGITGVCAVSPLVLKAFELLGTVPPGAEQLYQNIRELPLLTVTMCSIVASAAYTLANQGLQSMEFARKSGNAQNAYLLGGG